MSNTTFSCKLSWVASIACVHVSQGSPQKNREEHHPSSPHKKSRRESSVRPFPSKKSRRESSVPSPQKKSGVSHSFPSLKKTKRKSSILSPKRKIEESVVRLLPSKKQERVTRPLIFRGRGWLYISLVDAFSIIVIITLVYVGFYWYRILMTDKEIIIYRS